ncbi:MAG: vWA domain-containing protein [Kofleriaceae bacterium]
MNRLSRLLFAVSLAACGGKSGETTLCDGTANAPAACSQACDPTPNAPNTCPSGYHCNQAGVCDAQCVIGDDRCPAGTVCSSDGYCNNDGTGVAGDVDADCPAIHFMAKRVTPSIEVVIDRSGSMSTSFGSNNGTRSSVLLDALFNTTSGAVTTTQAEVYFGLEMFSGAQTPCTDGPPGAINVTGHSVTRALSNSAAMATVAGNASNKPSGSTPTAAAIGQAYADFVATPPPADSPPIILLATDGEPNSCGGGADNNNSVNQVAQAYLDPLNIKTYVVGLNLQDSLDYLQAIANAGVGRTSGAKYYNAESPQDLIDAVNSIITSAISCDLTINQNVDPASAPHAIVTLNGMTLVYGTDWTLVGNNTIHIQGTACVELKNTPGADVEATFPCGSVIQ